MSQKWALLIPILGIAAMVSIPVVRNVQKIRSEAAAVDLLKRIHVAQGAFRTAIKGGGYASDLASLLTPCANGATTAITSADIAALSSAGYDVSLRAAETAATMGVDCHGRAIVSNYYAATAPQTPESAGQQAFATTASGRIYVFFDGIPPLERDMGPFGLATPLEALPTFKIP